MKEHMESKKCKFCEQPLVKARNSLHEEIYVCSNTQCPGWRLTSIETRLSAIERKLNIESVPIRLISEVEEELITPLKDDFILEVETLTQLSIQRGLQKFRDLDLTLGRNKLLIVLNETAESIKEDLSRQIRKKVSSEYYLENLRKYAILMAYVGKPFVAAQEILEMGGEKAISLIQMSIERANSVIDPMQKEIEPIRFYKQLLIWAEDKGIDISLQDELKTLAGIKPEIEVPSVISEPSTVATTGSPALQKELIDISMRPPVKPRESWIDRFRPKEGWEFAFGANLLRWIGVGVILFAIFSFVIWSGQQIDLTTEQLAIIIFICAVVFAIFLHTSSFPLLSRAKKHESRYIKPIAYSLAFLALGVYFLILFALRFHPSSPVSGVNYEELYIILCLVLIILAIATAWGHGSSILFLEGFSFVFWLIWHMSSQVYVNNLSNFPIDILWISYLVFVLVFLGIAYIRKDMILTTSIQLLALSLVFLPNSSEIFSSHLLLEDINATIILLCFLSLIYLLISFRFPLTIPNQFYELITRDHLSISSVTPVFASFFLLSFDKIHGNVFIPFFLVFTSIFLCLAYYQKDLGVAFLITLLTQFLWLLSIGTMENIYIFFPEINNSLIILLFLTFTNWIVAIKFPTDVESRFWQYVNHKHLTIVATGPIFVSFIMTLSNFIVTSIFIIYLILFCILWSSVRTTTVNIPNLSLQNLSLFDFVAYVSAVLFLVTVVFQPGDDILGLLLGFFVFPLFMLSAQSISRISIQGRANTKEYYAIINSGFISITYIVMVWGNIFSQFSEIIFEITSIVELQYSHNWAFLAYLWVLLVTIITALNFRTEIHHYGSKLTMGISSLIAIFWYLSLVHVSEIIAILVVIVSYIQIFILWHLLEPRMDPEARTISKEFVFIIPTLAGIQIIAYLLQERNVIYWNIIIGLLINLILPLLLGVLMILRKRINHMVDSYLISSTFIMTFLQFSFLNSCQQGEAWLIHTVYLGLMLLFIYGRILFKKDTLNLSNDSQTLLSLIFKSRSSFSNKDHNATNLMLFSVLGLINTTLCFDIFGATFFPTIVLLIFDSIVVIPIVFALILVGISKRVAIANTLILYGTVMLFRLPIVFHLPLMGSNWIYFPFMREVDEFNWFLFLIAGLSIQIIVHFILIRLKAEISESPVDKWQLEFKGRKSWTSDSFRLMVVINPLIFYIITLELTIRVGETIKASGLVAITMLIIAVIIGTYFVILTKINIPKTMSESGLFLSILVAWLFTFDWKNLIELIYFTTGTTAFLCILYGFWTIKKEWRLLGLGIIGGAMVFSALYLVNIGETLLTIAGFGLLGIISIIIGLVYTKFSKRFEIDNSKEGKKDRLRIRKG